MSEITDPARLVERYKQANAAMSEELIKRTQERDRYRAALDRIETETWQWREDGWTLASRLQDIASNTLEGKGD